MLICRVAPCLVALAACASLAACAGAVVRPSTAPTPRATDALLVLPGFGYSRAGEAALRALAKPMAAEGVDLFVPTYIARGGLTASRANLQRFIHDQRLDQYAHLHVFAFIAGAWTFNPLMNQHLLPNLATVVYDRSPYQERAPRIADDTLHFLTWVKYGSPVFDVARTPYVPLAAPDVKVAITVETIPSRFVRRRAAKALSYGPVHFECAAFTQRYDDCLYLSMSHDDVYVRFAEVWPQMLAFMRGGRFTSAAERTPPSGDPLAASLPP